MPIGTCSICFVLLTNDGIVCLKNCGHTFHENCIQRWIDTSTQCPICRKNAGKNDVLKLYFDKSNVRTAKTPEIQKLWKKVLESQKTNSTKTVNASGDASSSSSSIANAVDSSTIDSDDLMKILQDELLKLDMDFNAKELEFEMANKRIQELEEILNGKNDGIKRFEEEIAQYEIEKDKTQDLLRLMEMKMRDRGRTIAELQETVKNSPRVVKNLPVQNDENAVERLEKEKKSLEDELQAMRLQMTELQPNFSGF